MHQLQLIVDDLEDTETIDDELLRQRRKEWFFDDLMKYVSTTEPECRLAYIDTLGIANSIEELAEKAQQKYFPKQ